MGIGIKREFWRVISVYAAGMEGLNEKRDMFWEGLKGCGKAYEDKGIALEIGAINTRKRNTEVEGVVGKFGMPVINKNGVKLIECLKYVF